MQHVSITTTTKETVELNQLNECIKDNSSQAKYVRTNVERIECGLPQAWQKLEKKFRSTILYLLYIICFH